MAPAADFGLFIIVLLGIALAALSVFLCNLRVQYGTASRKYSACVLACCLVLLLYAGFQRVQHQVSRNFEVHTYHVIVQWNWRLSPEEFLDKIRAFSDERPAELMIVGIRNVSPNRPRGVIEVNTQLSGRELVSMLMAQGIVEKAEVDQQWRGD